MNLSDLVKDLFASSNKLITTHLSFISTLGMIYLLSLMAGTWLETNSSLYTSEINFLLNTIMFLVEFFILYLLTKAALKLWAGHKTTLNNISVDFPEFIKYIVTNILYILLIMVGVLLLVIPGIYFALKYFLVPYLIIDKKLSIMESFKESSRLTQGRKLTLLPFFMLTVIPMVLLSILLYNRIPQYALNFIYTPWMIYTTIFLIGLYKKFAVKA